MCRHEARKHEQWIKDVLKKYEKTNMENAIMYIMAYLKPQLAASESILRTAVHPESVQHHFNTQLYVDDFVTAHKSHIRQSMSKFSMKWKMPHVSISFPYTRITNDDWRNNCRITTSIINMSEAHKRSIDLLLS